MPDALPLLAFADVQAFEAWLAAQPVESAGAWLKFAKAGAPEPTLGKSEAIDSAIAHGWIDGQLGRVDGHYFKTRFTPRKARSAWSQVNRERAERLIAEGRMTVAGLAQVEAAKADGRWDAAYAPQSRATVDDDLAAALAARPEAQALFEALDSANRYAVLYRIRQARTPERRAAKIAEIVAMLARGETFHPRRGKRTG